MANASVDKLKVMAMRHGEKVVVVVAATLFVVFAAMGLTRPTLDIQPDQLNTAADNAASNINKPQDPKDILDRLEKDGVKDPDFVKLVDNQQANALKAADYRARLDWVTPEPGAGLIRDQPELIAPTELAAFPGRGGILMYALDAQGNRVLETAEDEKAPKKKRRPQPPGGTSYMPPSGPPGGMPGAPPKDESPEDKKRREAEEERIRRSIAGKAAPTEKGKAEEVPATPEGPWKEETRGKRWVVITGIINNEQLKKNYLLALKNPAIAYPNYKRLDVERQTLNSDGTWSEWGAIDQSKNYEVLDNLPELDAEYVPEPQRPASLVDPLPFLRAGYWTGVHVAQLVPSEVLEAPKAGPPGGRMGGMGMQGSEMGGRSMPGPGMSGPGPGGMSMQMGPGMSSQMGPGGMMGGPGGTSGEAEEANFTKIEEPTLMLRSLDFTVEPDSTYRFRARIVVVNPNKDHTDVNPGVDVDSKELLGPWSDPTSSVTVPADVASYVQSPEQVTRRTDLVSFQVIKWDPATGQTVVKNDTRGPGQIVGEYGSVPMPSADGGGTKPANIDFNSRSIVLDTFGGRPLIPDIGVERTRFEIPALAMVVEPDGSVVIRSQARDKADEVRQDMEANYQRAKDDSGKKREAGAGGSLMPADPRAGGMGKKKR